MPQALPPRPLLNPLESYPKYRNQATLARDNTGHQTAHEDLMFHLKWPSACFAGSTASRGISLERWRPPELADGWRELFPALPSLKGSGMRRAQSRLAGLAWNGDDHSVHMTASMCRIFRASEIWVLVSIWPYMPTRKARCSSTGACSVGESSQAALGQQRLPGQQWALGGGGAHLGRAGCTPASS